MPDEVLEAEFSEICSGKEEKECGPTEGWEFKMETEVFEIIVGLSRKSPEKGVSTDSLITAVRY